MSMNNTWYYNVQNPADINKELDWDKMTINEQSGGKSFIHYPNIPAGFPSITIELENFGDFQLPRNYNSGDGELAKRYPITYLKDSIYTVFIPSYEYTTESGVHVTKVVTSLRRKDNNDILIDADIKNVEGSSNTFYRFEDDHPGVKNLYYILKKADAWFDTINFKSFGDYEFNNMVSNSLYHVDIGSECNVWMVLTVDYYFNDLLLGTYTNIFNPYAMDIVKVYGLGVLLPETEYHGYSGTYLPLCYDITLDLQDPLQFSKRDTKSSDGNNDLSGGLAINTNDWLSKANCNNGYDINSLDYINIDSSVFNYSAEDNASNFKYLYKKQPVFEKKSLFEFSCVFNNFGVRLVSQNGVAIKAPFNTNNGTVEYYLFPPFNKKVSLEGYNPIDIYVVIRGTESEEKFTWKSENEEEIKALNGVPIGRVHFYSSHSNLIKTTHIDVNHPFYLDKHKYWNNSSYTYTTSSGLYSTTSNASNYSIIPLLNMIYSEDGIEYEGFLKDGITYKSGIDTSKNYLMKNLYSEIELNIPDDDYKMYDILDTSILFSGFTYYSINATTFLERKLSKGIYFLNFNFGEVSNLTAVSKGTLKFFDLETKTLIKTISSIDLLHVLLVVDKSCYFTLSLSAYSILFSCGMYKVDENEVTEALLSKITTAKARFRNTVGIITNEDYLDYVYPLSVYLYSEKNVTCLNKTYSYNGSAPFKGYLVKVGNYTLNSTDSLLATIDNQITYQVRKDG